MKLKHVVALMVVGGLMSSPVLADEVTKTKHKHHHKKVHHHVVAEKSDFRGDLKGEIPVQEIPKVDTYQLIYDSMSQNTNRAMHTVLSAGPDWTSRIGITGGANFDAHWGNRSFGVMGENNSRLSLNDVYFNANALVNDWTRAFLSISFDSASGSNGKKGGQYDSAYSFNTLRLEQGYITFANYNELPLFVQVGKQYADYGRYTIHPITRTLTQVMTESLQTSAKVGFITPMGFNGQVYAFENPLTQVGAGHQGTVWGAALGYAMPNDVLGYDVGVGYMSNITGVNDIANAINNFSNQYSNTVGGVAVYGDVNSGPFGASARYTRAIQHFNPMTLSTQFGKTSATLPGVSGAQPWAGDITVGYGFNYWNKNQNVYVGYQASGDAVNLDLPKNRWLVGYNVDMWTNASIGAEFIHNQDYSTGNLGTGRSYNTLAARAAVKFG